MIVEKIIEIEKANKHINNLKQGELTKEEKNKAKAIQKQIDKNIEIDNFISKISIILNTHKKQIKE